jgi:two-component system sensor histidine kinase KdpD
MACALLAVQLMPGDRLAAGPALLVFAAALMTATVLGGRFGLAASLLGVIILAAISDFPRGLIDLAIGCALAAGVFWAGRVADRMNHRGAILRATLAASQQIAAADKGDDVWAALFTGLTQLSPRGSFRLVDAEGQVIREAIVGSLAEPAGGWQERVLVADGQKFASLQWTRGLDRTDRLLIDGAVTALADSAGSSYLRLRLAAEKQAIEFAARTEQVRVLMLDAVSHHFKTPLAGILGSVTSILALPATHKRGSHQDLLLIIKDQANTLNRYIDKFLAVARLESGSIVPRPAPIQLEPMIYDVWESLGAVGGARRFLRVKIEPVSVFADEGLLKQVFSNVLENAIKYSPEESLVEVSARMAAGKMNVDIQDEGAGFPADSAEPIFERFYRAKSAKPAGLGLGLYITRSLLKILGGSVSARNRSDRTGAIFSIVLPVAKAA